MRKVLLTLLLIFLIFPVDGRQEIYSKAIPSDEGIYLYFSDILKSVGGCLDEFLKESPNAINLSTSLEQRIRLTYEEEQFYAAKGFMNNVSIVIPSFISLSDGTKELINSQPIFLENIRVLDNKKDYFAYIKAKTALINMRLAANKINSSLNDVEKIELWNGTSKLKFDVLELKSKLNDVYDLITYYENMLAKFEAEYEIKSLVVAVSDTNPFLNQEITIYVYARNVTPTLLFIDNVEFEIGNRTSIRHSFRELGEHVIYAKGTTNGRIIKSNIVKVHVRKILTCINLYSKSTAFLRENVEVKGFLSDYYGNPIEDEVRIKIEDEEIKLTTNNGFFSFNVTKGSEGVLNISAFYAGNETYNSSAKTISIFFSRFLVTLYIEANKTQVVVNESVKFIGKIYGINYSIPIRVTVNSHTVKIFNATKEFNFTLNFPNLGIYTVFGFFPGDLFHRPTESNKIKILVVSKIGKERAEEALSKKIYNFLYLVILIAILISVVYLRPKGIKMKFKMPRFKKIEDVEKEDKIIIEKMKKDYADNIPQKIEKEIKVPKGISEAYNTVFNHLIDKYGFKKSITPLELLKMLKNENFADKLKIVTQLHEKAIYGNIELKDNEKKIYFKLIAEILEEIT